VNLSDVPVDGGPFVLKGETNSRKHQWNSHFYAEDIMAAREVYGRLMQDSLIGQQQIYIREYIPLKKLATGMNGMPVSIEFRCFVAYGELLSVGFYWSSHLEEVIELHGKAPDPSVIPKDFLEEVIRRVSPCAPAVVIDVAQKEDGGWVVIELNDLQQSGLSENSPETVYQRLQQSINRKQNG